MPPTEEPRPAPSTAALAEILAQLELIVAALDDIYARADHIRSARKLAQGARLALGAYLKTREQLRDPLEISTRSRSQSLGARLMDAAIDEALGPRDVERMVGLTRRRIADKVKAAEFPAPDMPSARRGEPNRWRRSTIEKYLAERSGGHRGTRLGTHRETR